MPDARLMKPLFVGGNFNREGKRIRAIHVKTISANGVTYPLWINAGKPDKDYTTVANDKYYLHVQCGEWLIPCGDTEYDLIRRSGWALLNREWYQGERSAYFNKLREGKTYAEYDQLVRARIEEEEAFIAEHSNDDAVQVSYLKEHFDGCIARYIDARDNGGRFADFVGAAFLGELDKCDKEVAQPIRERRKQEEAARRVAAAERERIEAEKEAEAEKAAMEAAEAVFLKGGKLTDGRTITQLADKYGISIPLRTKGWILNSLAEATFSENGSISLRYFRRAGSNARGSNVIYSILFAIQRAIREAKAA